MQDLQEWELLWGDALRDLAQEAGRQGLEVIRDELVPWALGIRDPLAERVAAREAKGSE